MFLLNSSYWSIGHAKKKGRGVFAKREISAGLVIGDYLGRVQSDEEAEKKEAEVGLYSMCYGPNTSIFPDDAKSPGVHLINHSCMPNCNTYPYRNHTLYFALRKIFPGEELTISYDMEYSDLPSPGSYACSCETLVCRGTMCVSREVQKQSDAFVEKRQKGWIDESRQINTVLLVFPHYPSSIRDHSVYDIFANTKKAPHVLTETEIPDIRQIRLLLRSFGVGIRFARIGIDIIGVYRGTLLVKKTD